MTSSNEKNTKKTVLTHARLDPAHSLAGIFKCINKKDKERETGKLDITYSGGDETVRFIGFEPLGADDQRVLQGLVALGGLQKTILDFTPPTERGQQLRLDLKSKFLGAIDNEKYAAMLQCNLATLLTEIGLEESGKNRVSVKASLLRMSNVTVVVTKGTRQICSHLMSFGFDDLDSSLFVALNPQITEAILGERQFTSVSMDDVRRLNIDAAHILYQRLCGWIDYGKTGRITIETLENYAYGEREAKSLNANTQKKRRSTIRKALAEISNLGWLIYEYSRGKFEITRPFAAISSKLDTRTISTLSGYPNY
jgi:hypothetical protein